MAKFKFVRLGILAGALLFGYGLTCIIAPLSDLIGLEDGIVFFLASYVFISAWSAASKIFTEHPIKFSRLLSLGLALIVAGLMLGAINSVSWRAFGVATTSNDTLIRFGQRYVVILGLLCVIAAPELFEQQLSARRLGQLGAILACVVLTALLLLYGSRLRYNHDNAPAPAFFQPAQEP